MGKGFWAGDAIAQAVEGVAASERRLAQAKKTNDTIGRLVADRENIERSNAANLAEKQALRVALAKLDPQHPLLTNKILQEKIKEAGKRALAMTNDFDAARDAGGSFKY